MIRLGAAARHTLTRSSAPEVTAQMLYRSSRASDSFIRASSLAAAGSRNGHAVTRSNVIGFLGSTPGYSM